MTFTILYMFLVYLLSDKNNKSNVVLSFNFYNVLVYLLDIEQHNKTRDIEDLTLVVS